MIRTGFEGYVSGAGDIGNGVLKSFLWLFRSIGAEMKHYVRRRIINHKIRKRNEKNLSSRHRNMDGRRSPGADRV